MSKALQQHLARRKQGVAAGIYSVCSAHPWVIRAAAEQAVEDGSLLLVEATSNQVNQFGGYTGMRPAAFRDFVLEIVKTAGLEPAKLVLGGDHLGPNPWRKQPAVEAMALAETMVAEYVAAGFTKIHLDASMACGDDATHPSDEVVAQRAARLCVAAEAARGAGDAPVYVIGTEVPVPGGATHAVHELPATSTAAAEHTLAVHKWVFEEQLSGVWERVIALVVQPGVEFDHDAVVDYDAAKASELVGWLQALPEAIVFEAHSTDYQRPQAYVELVRDGFAILKVGPALTFAMREALEALEDIESQLAGDSRSGLSAAIEETMLREPAEWLPYYASPAAEQKLLRRYSYSDRVRYYWGRPEIAAAVERLVANLAEVNIRESMLSRYLPLQYVRLRAGRISGDSVSLIVDHVRDVLREYAAACRA
ncbi:D-tagatose-bisphosphate aldolase, class II, non-catalytic subunit [Granulicella sp. 5B5]|uniref:D-tagatose-bisphosphate aldolase, class II, non-catalytic subunit n=1 Tax=Granulicella sp. 5B5 TaxID=1617967 RepID=UPI0015F5EB01|nr:D-tagatose-bisphosphate aldolase, class II, non-catalytic subunit [Granulicella sp. 5B5]QMV18348.1 D-tagatose-bisphosphate aldolase, class II, non-catalytic subunit [Granulicella sp. 5B5]